MSCECVLWGETFLEATAFMLRFLRDGITWGISFVQFHCEIE